MMCREEGMEGGRRDELEANRLIKGKGEKIGPSSTSEKAR